MLLRNVSSWAAVSLLLASGVSQASNANCNQCGGSAVVRQSSLWPGFNSPGSGSQCYAGPSSWQRFVETVETQSHAKHQSPDPCHRSRSQPMISPPATSYPTSVYSTSLYPGTCDPNQSVDDFCSAAPMRPLCQHNQGAYGGFEFLWIRPNFDQNVAIIIDPPVGNTAVPFDYDYELAPRTWLGWQSCRGGGFRSTYFRLDQDAPRESVMAVTGATPVFIYIYGSAGNLSRNAQANVGETLTSNHSLKLQALDLEATQHFRWQAFQGTLGGGVRLARVDQYFHGQVHNGAGVLQEAVWNDLKVSGIGPTLSFQATRDIARSRLSFYGGFRGSLLMGKTEQKIYEMKGAYTTELEDAASQREVLTTFEMSIGLQWKQSLGQHANCFARAGYECQAWQDVGGPVDSTSTIGLDAITLALGLQF